MAFQKPRGATFPACRPLVKWSGGKSGELGRIAAAMPPSFARLVEPFAGGAAVTFALPASVPSAANDRSSDLVALYELAAGRDVTLIASVEAFDGAWTSLCGDWSCRGDAEIIAEVRRAASMLPSALVAQGARDDAARAATALLGRKRRMLEKLGAAARDPGGAILSAMKGGLYTSLRSAFNRGQEPGLRAALFWFLRDFAYGGMFRRSAAGDFNVPYGGLSYNARRPAARLDQIAAVTCGARLRATTFRCADFEDFLDGLPTGPDDFVFLDPPYDSRFVAYDGAAFGQADHRRLAAWMARTRSRWMLVIAATDFVKEAYCGLPGTETTEAAKTYASSIKNRYDRRATHLMVTNYDRDTGAMASWSHRPQAMAA